MMKARRDRFFAIIAVVTAWTYGLILLFRPPVDSGDLLAFLVANIAAWTLAWLVWGDE